MIFTIRLKIQAIDETDPTRIKFVKKDRGKTLRNSCRRRDDAPHRTHENFSDEAHSLASEALSISRKKSVRRLAVLELSTRADDDELTVIVGIENDERG